MKIFPTILLSCLFIVFIPVFSIAQTPRNVSSTTLRATHINFTAGGFLPISDLNDRFGAFGTVGAGFGIKTEKNRYFGFRITLLTGAEAQEEGLLQNLLSPDGELIDNEGDVAKIRVAGRGSIIGFQAGIIIPTSKSNPNSGLFLRCGLGSIQHKIGFDFTENRITQLEDPYLAGYDRLTWGAYASGFVGFWHMGSNRRINAFGGLWGFAARTAALRTTNFDTGIPDISPRFDAGIGLEIGWVLHIYKRAAREYWY